MSAGLAYVDISHTFLRFSRPLLMASAWLQAGEVTLPPKGELFYLSQRPYLVAGTLRDQLLYPEPPRDVWAAASERTRQKVGWGRVGRGWLGK